LLPLENGCRTRWINQTITQWGHVFGDEVIAAAVLDRVLHHSHVWSSRATAFVCRW
jgi:DNA replication protein DnaC